MWELLAIVKNLALIWNELGSHWVALSKAMTWSWILPGMFLLPCWERIVQGRVRVEEGTPARRVM